MDRDNVSNARSSSSDRLFAWCELLSTFGKSFLFCRIGVGWGKPAIVPLVHTVFFLPPSFPPGSVVGHVVQDLCCVFPIRGDVIFGSRLGQCSGVVEGWRSLIQSLRRRLWGSKGSFSSRQPSARPTEVQFPSPLCNPPSVLVSFPGCSGPDAALYR